MNQNRHNQMKLALLAILMTLGLGASAHSMEALKYEPSVVTLRGTLSLQDFAGPPNYEDVKQGDRLERAWVLVLSSPVRVVASPDDELFYTQENVKEIQLVCFTGCGERFSFSSGETVTLSGTLFSAHSGHHHKGVLMTVNKRKK
ncbi:MAG: hypothetical protein RJB38_1459 [Pseudomonadota bacterium]